MSDESRELKIKITGDASSLVGASQQGAQSLNELGGATKQEGAAQEETAGKAEKNVVSHRALHQIAHSLNEVFPGLGSVMMAAFNPVTAAVMVVVGALSLFRDKMKELNDEFQKREDEATKPVLHTTEALREETVQMAVGMEKLRERLEDARRAEVGLKESMQETLQTMKLAAEQEQDIVEAEGRAELELLEQKHQAGLISEQEYNEARLKLEQEFRDKKRQLQAQGEMLEILAERRQVEQAEMQQPELTKAAEAAEKKKEAALANLASMRTRSDVEGDKTTTDAALKAFQRKYPEWSQWFVDFGLNADPTKVSSDISKKHDLSAWQASGGFGGILGGKGLAEEYAEWVKLQTAADSAKTEWEKQPAEQARRQVEADRAAHEAERASKRAEDNQDFSTRGNRDIDQRRTSYDIHQAGVSQVEAREHEVLKQMVHHVTSASEARIRVYEAMIAHMRSLGQRDLKIEGELSALKAQMRNSSNNPT